MNTHCMICGHKRHDGVCPQPFVPEWMTFTTEQRAYIGRMTVFDFDLLKDLLKEPKFVSLAISYGDLLMLAIFTHFGLAQTVIGKHNQFGWAITTFGEKALKFQ